MREQQINLIDTLTIAPTFAQAKRVLKDITRARALQLKIYSESNHDVVLFDGHAKWSEAMGKVTR